MNGMRSLESALENGAVLREGAPSQPDLERVLVRYAANVSHVAGFFEYGLDAASFREDA